MHWRSCARSVAIGGICLIATLMAGVLIVPVHAQAQQVNGFNPFDPQWAPYMPFGFNAGASVTSGITQQATTAKFGSGTLGLFVASNAQDDGARAIGTSGNFFDPLPFSTAFPRQDWFTGLGDPAWRTSIVGSYRSNPNTALFDGLYTTASFGVTSFRTNPLGIPGLTNFTAGNDAVGVSARAGVGLQLTPQISIEGSVGFTQTPGSAFR